MTTERMVPNEQIRATASETSIPYADARRPRGRGARIPTRAPATTWSTSCTCSEYLTARQRRAQGRSSTVRGLPRRATSPARSPTSSTSRRSASAGCSSWRSGHERVRLQPQRAACRYVASEIANDDRVLRRRQPRGRAVRQPARPSHPRAGHQGWRSGSSRTSLLDEPVLEPFEVLDRLAHVALR